MKNYRERLEKYQNKQLTEQEAAAFEKELQDAASLFDYLMENETMDDFTKETEMTSFTSAEKNVKKNIRKRFLRSIFFIIVIVLGVVGGTFLLYPKIADAYYYNPMKGQKIDKKNYVRITQPSNFGLYQQVYSQIHLETDRLVDSRVTQIGPAKYTIDSSYYNDFSNTLNLNATTIEKGKIIESSGNPTGLTFSQSSFNVLALENDYFVNFDSSELHPKIADLPDSSWLKIQLTFKEPKSWEELTTFIQQHEEVNFYTASIEMAQSNLQPDRNLGVRLEQHTNYHTLTLDYDSRYTRQLEMTYPNLFSHDSALPLATASKDVKEYIQSNVQYLLDHPEDKMAAAGISYTNDDEEFYQTTLDYLENTDLRFDKIEVALPKDTFASFVTDQDFYYVKLRDLLFFSLMD
ncbi:hypothetical protein [Candidatus Enterococcus willemsii]|uniref:Sigma factor regulator C-terminal domain-containing protein n=1 Tax=Candidatus Enterococcus willemsii TaxID=1857215 RepID=A0ABQ6YZX8_9ENTE|nr:hypothetical protein [Enterococcus sp. CU12B]KAF1303998.1 hypothetical protein BAU17_03675 [Enterococcus sp. CU12B]